MPLASNSEKQQRNVRLECLHERAVELRQLVLVAVDHICARRLQFGCIVALGGKCHLAFGRVAIGAFANAGDLEVAFTHKKKCGFFFLSPCETPTSAYFLDTIANTFTVDGGGGHDKKSEDESKFAVVDLQFCRTLSVGPCLVVSKANNNKSLRWKKRGGF